ncbi:MAG: hypothetical protein Q4B81_04720 [Moraxella sp.]|nr:hypothetical protein [Moraxella sp.]
MPNFLVLLVGLILVVACVLGSICPTVISLLFINDMGANCHIKSGADKIICDFPIC